MANGTSWFTCFISYGQPDLRVAQRLVADLQAKNVRVWFYEQDKTPGARTQREIGEARREAEKVIVLCSVESLIQEGVLSEIDDQIRENPDKVIPVSLDDVWQHPNFHIERGSRDLKPFLLERNYADFRDESAYEESFQKLLGALECSARAGESPEEQNPRAPANGAGAQRGVLKRRILGIASLLILRERVPPDRRDLEFAAQILDELASVIVLKYDLLPTENLLEPLVYVKLVEFLRESRPSGASGSRRSTK